MGTSLRLQFDENEYSADKNIVDTYYANMLEKLRRRNYGVNESDIVTLQQKEVGKAENSKDGIMIYEQYLSSVRDHPDTGIGDVFDLDADPPIIYNSEIKTLIERLRDSKEIMKREGDAERWEHYFELQLIGLCEFALENEYGVVLSL
jgi:hypothetical protein